MSKNIHDIELLIRRLSRHLFSLIQEFPGISATLFLLMIFLSSIISKKLAEAFTAIGTILAVIWALYHQEIKYLLEKPILEIENIILDYPFFRSVRNQSHGRDYYINVPLLNRGKRTAKNCSVILFSIYEIKSNKKWKKIVNWLPLPLKWAADEREFEDVIIEKRLDMSKHKIASAERNIVPNRPYFFNLGVFHVDKSRHELCQFILLTFPQLKAQTTIFKEEGHFCYEVKVIAEEVEPLIKYFYLKWRWDCDVDPLGGPEIIIWEIRDNPPT